VVNQILVVASSFTHLFNYFIELDGLAILFS